MSEPLYRRVGRRYEVACNADSWERDLMKPGTFRLVYASGDGERRYSCDVRPDTAGFVAAAEMAMRAMEDAIHAASIPSHADPVPYTRKQLAIIEQFRADMAAAGALTPSWWLHKSPREIAQAGIDAVQNWRG